MVLLLCVVFFACKKSNQPATGGASRSSFSFSANDTTISFPVNLVFIQDVLDLHTTLITGQYADTSSKQGNISIRFLGDTTGRYRAQGDSLTVTYTDPLGIAYYNTPDTNNYVQVDKFPKTPEGMVTGSFHCRVFHGTDSLLFSNGAFMAPYQD